MGFLSGLFGGDEEQSQTSTTKTEVPAYWQAYMESLTGAGSARFLNAAYPGKYPGTRVAPNNADIDAARTGVRDMQGDTQPMQTQAAGMTSAAGNPMVDQSVLQSFMNPYSTLVTDRIRTEGLRDLDDSLKLVNKNFISGGNFGSGEHGNWTTDTVSDAVNRITGIQGEYLSKGFDSSMGNYQTAQGRQLNAGAQTGVLARMQQDIALRDAAALEEVGKDERNRGQLQADFDYGQHVEARDWDRNMARGASDLMRGYSPETTTTTTSTGDAGGGDGSGLGQLLGLGTSVLGMFGFRKGGRVPKRGVLRLARRGAPPPSSGRGGALRSLRA